MLDHGLSKGTGYLGGAFGFIMDVNHMQYDLAYVNHKTLHPKTLTFFFVCGTKTHIQIHDHDQTYS